MERVIFQCMKRKANEALHGGSRETAAPPHELCRYSYFLLLINKACRQQPSLFAGELIISRSPILCLNSPVYSPLSSVHPPRAAGLLRNRA